MGLVRYPPLKCYYALSLKIFNVSNVSKFRKSLKINVGQAKCRKVDMCFHEIKVLSLTSLVYISNWILSLNGVDCRDM